MTAGQDGLGRVRLVDGSRAHERQDAEHQDADAGPEVAAVDGDQELADDDQATRSASRATVVLPAPVSRLIGPWIRNRKAAVRISHGTSDVEHRSAGTGDQQRADGPADQARERAAAGRAAGTRQTSLR